jgi:hypothetical protein
VETYAALSLELVSRIAALLHCRAVEMPYRAAGAPVFELRVPSRSLGVPVALLLWTGLARADVRIGDSSMVFKEIAQVELYPGVEVLFRRRDPPGYLFVSVDGRASMVV